LRCVCSSGDGSNPEIASGPCDWSQNGENVPVILLSQYPAKRVDCFKAGPTAISTLSSKAQRRIFGFELVLRIEQEQKK
jgi:hypothetical protein